MPRQTAEDREDEANSLKLEEFEDRALVEQRGGYKVRELADWETDEAARHAAKTAKQARLEAMCIGCGRKPALTPGSFCAICVAEGDWE